MLVDSLTRYAIDTVAVVTQDGRMIVVCKLVFKPLRWNVGKNGLFNYCILIKGCMNLCSSQSKLLFRHLGHMWGLATNLLFYW